MFKLLIKVKKGQQPVKAHGVALQKPEIKKPLNEWVVLTKNLKKKRFLNEISFIEVQIIPTLL